MSEEKKFHEYPKAMHGPEDGYAVVHNKEEEDALGEGWVDGHKHWAAKAEQSEEAKPKKAKKAKE